MRQAVADLKIANPTVLEVIDRIDRAERAAEIRALPESRGEEPEAAPSEESGSEASWV